MTRSHSPAAGVALHELARMTADGRAALLRRPGQDLGPYVKKVRPIVEAVRDEGDAALIRFARAFDGADLTGADLMAGKAEFDAAFDRIDAAMIETLEYAADNIRRFHETQRPPEIRMTEIRPGVLVGERFTPVDDAAIYTPRGKGSFPSMTLMACIPAVVAGVRDLILLTPPGPDGRVDPATLVAARLAGVERVYKAGGAVAVAAAAFGTATVPRTGRFEGPGSPWVLAAKELLRERIFSRLPAGPSESIVLSDGSVDAETAARDLLIEAEHGPDSSAFLVTWLPDHADEILAILPRLLRELAPDRAAWVGVVLGGKAGGVVLAPSPEEAARFVNDHAPEHLQILSRAPFDHLGAIRNASEILLGPLTAGSIANYVMGPNAVLPTGGAARYHSPLGVADFMKSASLGQINAAGYSEMARHTRRFARYEGFDAHGQAVPEARIRIVAAGG
ncbi:histidinol dehydrogenase [Pseudogemmobacter sonorensis]|uniref:histidinol dehydrogenase n=1 Tax=Pseudogemmobacter sonorensis TaxID=2989681 RepID=UPI00369EEE37